VAYLRAHPANEQFEVEFVVLWAAASDRAASRFTLLIKRLSVCIAMCVRLDSRVEVREKTIHY
jgi:hypothetical protein